jgi:hypothetical protein
MKRTLLTPIFWGVLAAGVGLGTTGTANSANADGRIASDGSPVAFRSRTQAKAQPSASGQLALGTVKLPRNVTSDGKLLPAGVYQVRRTGQEGATGVTGATSNYERWVEFVQGGQVKGRELASIIPRAEAKNIVKGVAPAPGRATVQMLRGNDYLRVWINSGGDHYLIHLVPTSAPAGS